MSLTTTTTKETKNIIKTSLNLTKTTNNRNRKSKYVVH